MTVVCTAHNGGRSCVPYLPHQPAASAASKKRLRRCGFVCDGMRAARAASETNSATNAQIYETAARFGGLLPVRRTRPAYGRTSDAKGFDALRLSTSDFAVDFTAGFAAVCTAESTAVRAAISREYAHLSTLSTELSTARAQMPSGSTEKGRCGGALIVLKKLISKNLYTKRKLSKAKQVSMTNYFIIVP